MITAIVTPSRAPVCTYSQYAGSPCPDRYSYDPDDNQGPRTQTAVEKPLAQHNMQKIVTL